MIAILKRAGLVLVICLTLTMLPQNSVKAETITVYNTNNSGPGSLREAIEIASYSDIENAIYFNIPLTDGGYNPTTGVFTINLQSPLGIGGGFTHIDGNSQAENQGDTNPDGLEIAITLINTGSFSPAIWITSPGNSLISLAINGITYGVGMTDAVSELDRKL